MDLFQVLFYSYVTDNKNFGKYGCSLLGNPWYSVWGSSRINIRANTFSSVHAATWDVIKSHFIDFHSYADDKQLYIGDSPNSAEPVKVHLNCILGIKSWTAENFLQVNWDKTEVSIIIPEDERGIILQLLANCKHCVRNLDIIFDWAQFYF